MDSTYIHSVTTSQLSLDPELERLKSFAWLGKQVWIPDSYVTTPEFSLNSIHCHAKCQVVSTHDPHPLSPLVPKKVMICFSARGLTSIMFSYELTLQISSPQVLITMCWCGLRYGRLRDPLINEGKYGVMCSAIASPAIARETRFLMLCRFLLYSE